MERKDWRPGKHGSTPRHDIGQCPADMDKGACDLSKPGDFRHELRVGGLVMSTDTKNAAVGRIDRLTPKRALVAWRNCGREVRRWVDHELLVEATTELIAERVNAARQRERAASSGAQEVQTCESKFAASL